MTETIAPPSSTRTVDGVEVPVTGVYALDASHSHVGFAVRHMMVSKVRGQFTKFSGTVTIAEDPAASSVEIEVDLASIDTNDEKRDGHLRSADFFDTDTHPTMTFRSTGVRRGKGERWILTGDLTLNDVDASDRPRSELRGLGHLAVGHQQHRLQRDRQARPRASSASAGTSLSRPAASSSART